jgi:FMN phosphatase YigB (HAD superfamily)
MGGDIMTAAPQDIVFLIDVDNTLLDNDKVIQDLRDHLAGEFGSLSADRYWTIFEDLRKELGYADYLGALQRYRVRELLDPMNDVRLLQMSSFLIDYPFADRLYLHSLSAIRHLQRFGTAVILSDGDVVFQPRKIQRSGLWQAVDGNVLIYIHKELMLDAVQQHYPARHYVMVDDKLRILAAMKQSLGHKLTTIFVRQGHYALDATAMAALPPADIALEGIGDLINLDLRAVLPKSGTSHATPN